MKKQILKITTSVVLLLMVCAIPLSVSAYNQVYRPSGTVSLNAIGSTGSATLDMSESYARYSGTAQSTSSNSYTVTVSASGMTTKEGKANPNGSAILRWSSVLRDRQLTFRLYNGGETTTYY